MTRATTESGRAAATTAGQGATRRRGRPVVQFGPPPSNPVNVQSVSVTVGAQPAKAKKAPRAKAEKSPCDPTLVSAARELRDRYLEQVNAPGALEASGALATGAKYDVARANAIEGPTNPAMQFHPARQKRLPAAA